MDTLKKLWWTWCDACVAVARSRPLARLWRWLKRTGNWLADLLTGQTGIAEGLGGWLDRLTLNDDPVFLRQRRWLSAFLERNGSQWFKIRLSALLLLSAGLVAVLHGGPASAWIAVGMGVSFIGDALLMEYRPISRLVRQFFLWGMIAFAAAQVCYIVALRPLYFQGGSYMMWPMYTMIGIYLVVSLLELLRTVLFNKRQPVLLRLCTLPYAALVSTMAGTAAGVCIATAGRGWALLLAGLLFYVSDMLVALTNFGSLKMRHRDFWVWLLYVPAQLLLILGTMWLT